MSKCKKGGSLASDAVTNLVSEKAFQKMSLNASDVLSGGSNKKKPCNHKTMLVCAKCAKQLSGGSLSPAPKSSCGARGGSAKRMIKNINEYIPASPYKLWNGRGGSENKPIHIGLRTDSSINTFDKVQGNFQNRAIDASTLKVLANEDISGPIPMDKTAYYGDVTGAAELGTKFKYAGGSEKKKRVVTKKK